MGYPEIPTEDLCTTHCFWVENYYPRYSVRIHEQGRTIPMYPSTDITHSQRWHKESCHGVA